MYFIQKITQKKQNLFIRLLLLLFFASVSLNPRQLLKIKDKVTMTKYNSYSVSSRKCRKRNKSGLLPRFYADLSEEEKQQVKTAMKKYNSLSPDYFLEAEEFYQNVYRGIKRNSNSFLKKPSQNAKLPVLETKI
jgi:hypothetical protein